MREPAHAGSGYPEEPDEMRAAMAEWRTESRARRGALQGGLVELRRRT